MISLRSEPPEKLARLKEDPDAKDVGEATDQERPLNHRRRLFGYSPPPPPSPGKCNDRRRKQAKKAERVEDVKQKQKTIGWDSDEDTR